MPFLCLLIPLLALISPLPPDDMRQESGQSISARVTMDYGRPTIVLNDEPSVPMIYALTDVPGGRWSWEEVPRHNIRNFCARGFRLFQVDLFLEQLWLEDGRFDISLARKQIAGIREICPHAAVIIRFHVTAPKWWMRAHPEEWVGYADRDYEEEDPNGFPRIIEDDNYPIRRVSLASIVWRNEASSRLRQFLRTLAATPEGNSLAGIQIADGIYGEWHNWGFFRNEPDVSPAMHRSFRAWLRSRYGSDSALRKAWSRPEATIDAAAVPGMEERKATAGVFREPTRERQTIDYYTCVHQVVADNILQFARMVKETWPRPIVTGTFYGYFFSVFGRQAAGGHLALHRVLSSPWIDYLSGPQAYEPESLKPGEPYRSRSLITSLRLNGKLWLDEMDNEPTIPILREKNYDLMLRRSIANVRRNVLFTATKGMGLWFYDFGAAGVDLDGFRYNQRGSRGSWDHPDVMAQIESLKRLVESRRTTQYRSDADVLFVYDTESFYYTGSLRGTDPVSNVLLDFNTLNAFKTGVVFDPVHVQDLEKINVAQYRVVVFGNTYVLTDAQREFIRTRIARDGRTLVWFYAPGYVDGSTLNPEAVSRLTGIIVTPITIGLPPEVKLSFVQDSSGTYRLGDSPVAPLFAVTDPKAEPFGRFTATGETAVARKSFSDHTAWYVSIPNKGVEPMRWILRQSGAHMYVTQGEIVYAGGGMLVVHSALGGHHSITLRNGSRVAFDLPEGPSTLVLDPRTGETLLPNR